MLYGGQYGGLDRYMPKRAREITPIELKRLGAGLHAVGGVAGLHLQVGVSGGRSWLLRTMVGAKRREIGLGSYPEIGLAMARQKAAETRDVIRQGGDPVERRKIARSALIAAQKRGLLFSQAVDLFTPVKSAELSAGKYRDSWRDSIDKYAMPHLGSSSVEDIKLQDVLNVLEPIWNTKTVTADKLRRKLNELLDYATVKGHRYGPNPARWAGNLSMVLSAPSKVSNEENYPSLQLKDAARFWSRLATRDGMGASALRFQTLTATRSGAVRFMRWHEIDINQRIWTVQPGRQSSKIMRKDSPKRVPLDDRLMEILSDIPRQPDNDIVFWAPKGGALSDATMAKLMRNIHLDDVRAKSGGFVDAKTDRSVVPHGTRSTFKVWATEHAGYDWNLSEAALWHRLGTKVEQTYARTDLIDRRRDMMSAWGNFLAGSSS